MKKIERLTPTPDPSLPLPTYALFTCAAPSYGSGALLEDTRLTLLPSPSLPLISLIGSTPVRAPVRPVPARWAAGIRAPHSLLAAAAGTISAWATSCGGHGRRRGCASHVQCALCTSAVCGGIYRTGRREGRRTAETHEHSSSKNAADVRTLKVQGRPRSTAG